MEIFETRSVLPEIPLTFLFFKVNEIGKAVELFKVFYISIKWKRVSDLITSLDSQFKQLIDFFIF